MMRNMALAVAVKHWILGVWLCALLVEGEAAQGQRKAQLEVVTKYGHLRGKQASVEGVDQPVSVFLGIPFAKPPVGALRFSPPQPAEPWSHVRDSTSYPPMCLQDLEWVDLLTKILKFNVPNLTVSEDCLYLNIFTPDTKAKLPVMVWIHGGALVNGGASVYDGSALSAYENVVVVAIQYRLGLAGFFSTGSEDARGNWGLLDQVAALRWVQENIEHFGGDPHSVTIFGESAGGFSVGVQILSPLSKGLFHRAISESGVAHIPGLIITNPEVFTRKVVNISGCDSSSSALVRCLRSQPEDKLSALSDKLVQEMTFLPVVIDGEFLPKATEELFTAKEFNAVPYLLGMNNHEYGWIAPVAMKLPNLTDGMDRQTITAVLQQTGTLMGFPPEVRQSILDEYLGDTEDPVQLRNGFQDLMGDAVFVIPALQIARFHRDSGAPVYLYEFQHRPTTVKDSKPDFVKADHGDEVGFVLGWPFLRNDSPMLGEYTEEEKQLSRVIMKYWANFARNGNPNGKGLVEWPRYELNEEYLELNLEQKKGEKLRRRQADFWLKSVPEKMKQIRESTETHSEL
ncbi:fatty acyl-CoA hydrolase precursor, medium chain-like [Tiliqua scincoides]|uniref:fatty acyl-CoA hydrolase precursor, medium chain-like n=1 Tax=Tiliqua scincoides TaxID=71010 RepID=UPI0034624D36